MEIAVNSSDLGDSGLGETKDFTSILKGGRVGGQPS